MGHVPLLVVNCLTRNYHIPTYTSCFLILQRDPETEHPLHLKICSVVSIRYVEYGTPRHITRHHALGIVFPQGVFLQFPFYQKFHRRTDSS